MLNYEIPNIWKKAEFKIREIFKKHNYKGGYDTITEENVQPRFIFRTDGWFDFLREGGLFGGYKAIIELDDGAYISSEKLLVKNITISGSECFLGELKNELERIIGVP